METIETSLYIQKLETQKDESVALPDNIHTHVPTTLVFNNIDRIEETLSWHIKLVNRIAVQATVYGLHTNRAISITTKKTNT